MILRVAGKMKTKVIKAILRIIVTLSSEEVKGEERRRIKRREKLINKRIQRAITRTVEAAIEMMKTMALIMKAAKMRKSKMPVLIKRMERIKL